MIGGRDPARRHRRWVVHRGTPTETAHAADATLAGVEPGAVLWVGDGSARFAGTAGSAVKRLLGRAFDAVVIDGHRGVDADLLGRCQGFVWGGGCLILRLPSGAPPGDRRLAIEPYPPEAVGRRFFARVEAAFAESHRDPSPPRAVRSVEGTAEQAAVVDWLVARLSGEHPAHAVLLSDRGRGKSSALGLALARLPLDVRVAVSANDPRQCSEIFHFAPATAAAFVPIEALATGGERFDVIVVDEAAQVPVPLLQRVVRRHPEARCAFATTARGYEGTGRGFVLRFLRWLEGLAVPVERATLREPIRWAAGDPLEARVAHALLLDAEPAPVEPDAVDPAGIEHAVLDPDRLARDEALLRGFFGLLVHAHYRTTPADLARLLDAPNLTAHALLSAGRVVAACLCAREGELPAERVAALYRGEARIRGHALPETLVCHAGRPEAGELSMIRSVRIATHPALRRLGLASRLVAAVEAHHAPDLFGTLFGATPALLAFRRSVGYRLVRVGVNAGSRTGEPSAVMIRPVSARGHRVCGALRADLARDLPTQLALMRADGEVFLDDALVAALEAHGAAPSEMTTRARLEGVAAYALGPRPLEAAGRAISEFVLAHQSALTEFEPAQAALLRGRIIERRGWSRLTREQALPSVRATMRAMRRAMRAFVDRTAPGLTLPPAVDQIE